MKAPVVIGDVAGIVTGIGGKTFSVAVAFGVDGALAEALADSTRLKPSSEDCSDITCNLHLAFARGS